MAPLQVLLRCLQEAVKTTHPKETIRLVPCKSLIVDRSVLLMICCCSIPRNVINPVLQLSPLPLFPNVDQLVELFDGSYQGNCSRFDALSFQCILYVLLGCHWGLSQERGLCLFLVSGYHNPSLVSMGTKLYLRARLDILCMGLARRINPLPSPPLASRSRQLDKKRCNFASPISRIPLGRKYLDDGYTILPRVAIL